jgi:ribosomal protein L9
LDKRHLAPFRPVKELGKLTATFQLHPEVTADVEFEIVSENPIETEED